MKSKEVVIVNGIPCIMVGGIWIKYEGSGFDINPKVLENLLDTEKYHRYNREQEATLLCILGFGVLSVILAIFGKK